MSPPNPYVNYTGIPSFPLPQATAKRTLPNGTLTLTNAYQLLMSENAARRGFEVEASPANTTRVYVRIGASGAEYELSPGGSFFRNFKTGDVYTGEIYIKGEAGGETFIAEEH